MREATFLKQNEKKWKEYEIVLNSPVKGISPDVLADLFVEVSEDLSFSRTHFGDGKTTAYLNGLAARAHMMLMRGKPQKKGGFILFWIIDLPKVLGKHRLKLYWAFAIFSVSVAIGAISTHFDLGFVRNILSDEYVEMTLRNIERGNPMAVYASGGEIESFLGITSNNIRVSFLAFVGGLFLTLGTASVLISNGVMVGSFFTFMFQQGVGYETVMVVMIHGTLELSAIAIAGMAGFVLGHSLIFPGTYSRAASLRRGAMDGIKIVAGLVPIFVMAGFLEGFVTRHTDMPAPLSLCIISASLVFVMYYFVIFPLQIESRERLNNPNPNG
jgi:uncharacterized membrane protein SpoIIM required for sporulation